MMLMPLHAARVLTNPAALAVVLQALDAKTDIMDLCVPVVLVAPVMLGLSGACGILWRANDNQRKWLQGHIDRIFDEEVRSARAR